ncbi:MAG: RdgB/HAM1 family non-canonical purine NTP pyrophosphatase [Acidobacteria bacterium]|nr:RdgB/HAM1 family non-canonical purine NTP pyrophosphatase [Acidobacteriota bacterium]
MIHKLLIATHNLGKLCEIRDALSGLPIELISLSDLGIKDEPVESGETCAENARLKAVYYRDRASFPTLGDDSGLEVEALGGAPGPHSARYAGPDATDQDRIAMMLEMMHGIPLQNRRAAFVCALALAVTPVEVWEFSGRCEGRLLSKPRGLGGFGYDPLFVPDGENRSFAEMSIEEKRELSHRGRALAALRAYLKQT